MARQSIASGELAIGPTSVPPTVIGLPARADRDCRTAPRYRLRKHVDELTEVKPTFDGPWPEDLDLERVDAGIRDISGALDVYRERIRGGELAIDFDRVALGDDRDHGRLAFQTIQDRRPELAVHTMLKHMFDNEQKKA